MNLNLVHNKQKMSFQPKAFNLEHRWWLIHKESRELNIGLWRQPLLIVFCEVKLVIFIYWLWLWGRHFSFGSEFFLYIYYMLQFMGGHVGNVFFFLPTWFYLILILYPMLPKLRFAICMFHGFTTLGTS